MKDKKSVLKLLGSEWGQRLSILVVICLVMAFVEPKFFLPSNVLSILLAVSFYGIMACGMLFCVLVGGIDLSVGSMAALSGTVFALVVSNNGETLPVVILGLILGIAAGAVIGIIHGVFDVYLKMPAFVVTYATQYALYGLAQQITNLEFIRFSNSGGLVYKLGSAKLFGVQTPILVFAVCALITAFVLTKTSFGQKMYAVGGNRIASELVGIKTKKYTIIAYILSSVAAGLAGMILCAMNMVSQYNTARGYEGPVMMALVVGGVALEGGAGSVGGVIFGAVLVGILKNVLILIGINTDYNEFVQGLVILAAVALNVYTSRKSQGIVENRARFLRRKSKV